MAQDIEDVIRRWEDSPYEQAQTRGKEPRRQPDTDQKRIRREMARSAGTEESMTERTTEAEIADLMKAARLAPDLETAIELVDRAEELKTAKRLADNGKLDFSAMIIEDTLTPVPTHELHTTATDWITSLETTADLKAASQEMVVEASTWFNRVLGRNDESVAYRDEFDEQVKNFGRRQASLYGDQADAAFEVFRLETDRLRSMAVRNGLVVEAEMDGTPSYDPGTDTDMDLDYAGRDEANGNINELKAEAAANGEITPPMFKPGDPVQSFRGEGATVHAVYPSSHPGKSHRVQVKWDDPEANLTWDGKEHHEGVGDQTAYYEHVFSPKGKTANRHESASTVPQVEMPQDTFSNLSQNGNLPPEATSSNRAPIYQELSSGTDVAGDDSSMVDSDNADGGHRDASFGDDHTSFPVKASRKEANMDSAQCPTCAGHGRVAVRNQQRVAYSGLPQIDEIASNDDKPETTPYPNSVAFPWVLNPTDQVKQNINQAEQQISERDAKSPLLNKGAQYRTAGNDDSGWIGDAGGRGNGYPGAQDGGNAPGSNLGMPDPVYGYGGDNGNQPMKPYGAQEADDFTNNQGQNWQVGQPTQDDQGAQEIGATQTSQQITSSWQQAAANDPEIKRAQAFLQAKFAEHQANQGR